MKKIHSQLDQIFKPTDVEWTTKDDVQKSPNEMWYTIRGIWSMQIEKKRSETMASA